MLAVEVVQLRAGDDAPAVAHLEGERHRLRQLLGAGVDVQIEALVHLVVLGRELAFVIDLVTPARASRLRARTGVDGPTLP